MQLCASCGFTDTSKPIFAGSPSRGGDVTVYVFDMNRPSLPTPFYSVLVSLSVTALRFLTQFFQRYLCLTGSFNCVSLYVTLPQP